MSLSQFTVYQSYIIILIIKSYFSITEWDTGKHLLPSWHWWLHPGGLLGGPHGSQGRFTVKKNCQNVSGEKVRIKQDRGHYWSTRQAHSPDRQWLSLDFKVLGRTDGRTLCVKIVITTGRDCGRPRGSTRQESFFDPLGRIAV